MSGESTKKDLEASHRTVGDNDNMTTYTDRSKLMEIQGFDSPDSKKLPDIESKALRNKRQSPRGKDGIRNIKVKPVSRQPSVDKESPRREPDQKGEDSSGAITKLNESVVSEKLSARKKEPTKVLEVDEAQYYQLLKELKSRQVAEILTRTKKCLLFSQKSSSKNANASPKSQIVLPQKREPKQPRLTVYSTKRCKVSSRS